MVFNFEGAMDSPSLSYVSLSSSHEESLPPWFIICSSHQQGKMNDMGQGPYQLYGENGRHWFNFITVQDQGLFQLWGSLEERTIILGLIHDQPKLNFWYHICFEINTELQWMSVAVNGYLITNMTHAEGIGNNVPVQLGNKISLGKWKNTFNDYEEQFYWRVTNLQIFSDGLNISVLSGSPCSNNGDLLSWDTMDWTVTGSGVSQLEIEQESLCTEEEAYSLAIPIRMTQLQAINTCHKLGYGWMTGATNPEQLMSFVRDFQRKTLDKCSNVWTPYSDQTEEGFYINLEDLTPLNYSSWNIGQPNGQRLENAVLINLAAKNMGKSLEDVSKDIEECFSCSSTKLVSLKLLGVCRWTFLDDQYFLIENENYGVHFTGLTSCDIR